MSIRYIICRCTTFSFRPSSGVDRHGISHASGDAVRMQVRIEVWSVLCLRCYPSEKIYTHAAIYLYSLCQIICAVPGCAWIVPTDKSGTLAVTVTGYASARGDFAAARALPPTAPPHAKRCCNASSSMVACIASGSNHDGRR